MAFFFLIFAILGVSLWDGRSHFRCYLTDIPNEDGTWDLLPDDNRLCSEYRSCPLTDEGQETFCRSLYEAFDAGLLPEDFNEEDLNRDTDIIELNYGLTNFDDILMAFVTIFQCITMEGWTKIMNIYQDAYIQAVVVAYFMLCIIICSVFLLNLTIAVMLMKYEELDKEQESGESNIGKKAGDES